MMERRKGKGRRIRGISPLYEGPVPGLLEAGRQIQPTSDVLRKGLERGGRY